MRFFTTITNGLDTANATAVSVLRGGRGLIAKRADREQPALPLELYEFESCPFCKKVRDTFSELDLEYVSHSSARGSEKRAEVVRLGGKQQFPFLVDPNTGTQMYESDEIIAYLHEKYGNKQGRVATLLSPLDTASAVVASLVRPTTGRVVKKRGRLEQPKERLVLYNFEASPYCRKVRETLCELDLDVHVKNVAKHSLRRPELKELGGKMMVPYLVDPNTNTAMYESQDIISYLNQTYA